MAEAQWSEVLTLRSSGRTERWWWVVVVGARAVKAVARAGREAVVLIAVIAVVWVLVNS